jgi:hypothetical protein
MVAQRLENTQLQPQFGWKSRVTTEYIASHVHVTETWDPT